MLRSGLGGQHHSESHEGNSQQNFGELSENEALEILGLKSGTSDADIISSHRRLIQRLHPDRGGSDYLAAKINAAKDKLIS
jgi:DnaJ-class molecular chaperone